MASVVFVHGIGVRGEDYPGVWPHLQNSLARLRPSLPSALCYWGGDFGARLRTPGEPELPLDDELDPTEAQRLAEWSAFTVDPTWELASLLESAQHKPQVTPRMPGQLPAGPAIRSRLVDLGADPPIGYADAGLAPYLPDAVDDLLAAGVTAVCLARADAIGPVLPAALARAVVAYTLVRAERAGAAVLTGNDLDVVVNQTISALGGTPMGVTDWLRGFAMRLVRPYLEAGLRPVTWAMSRAREPITRGVTPYLGDVMVYLARGEAIRDEIVRQVEGVNPPTHVIAHSLGAIACLDLLLAGRLPSVVSLVTVGTQISYLYRIGALPSLAYGTVPPKLPRWINVYDRYDFLSFPAEPVFGSAVVTDHPIRGGVPFPMSHSAYFRSAAFYDLLDEVLP